jgi:hypothetical protein
MTTQEAKEILNKPIICKEAERSIREMKIRLSKYTGDKSEQTKHLNNLDNLLNLAHKQAIDLDTYEDLLATYLFKIGEQQAKIRELVEMHAISEHIHEVGIDEVVKDFKSKIQLDDRRIQTSQRV